MFSFVARNKIAFVTVLIVACMAALAQHIVRADAAFSHAYLEYAAVADDTDLAAYTPTATNNPLRQELNATLVDVLGDRASATERLARANRGIELLAAADTQVGAITPLLETSLAAIDAMEKSLSFGDGMFQRGNPQKIISLAKKRADAVNDIRAYSYRADFETARIFMHFIETKGVLTPEYIRQLNSEIPAAEEQFNSRQNRYGDLQELLNQIQAAYADFSSILKEPGSF